MKKTLTMIIATIATVAIIPTMSANAQVNKFRPNGRLKLDINADEHINAVDASLVLSEYAKSATDEGEFTITEKYVADFNDDGKIDAVDASGILAVYAQNSVEGEEYPITTIEFYASIKMGREIIPCGNAFLTYEEAMAALTVSKNEIASRRQIWDKAYIEMASCTMTDLPQSEVRYVYREET